MTILVIVDIETTGLSSSSDDIIEIGAVRVNTQTWKIVDTFQTFTKPEPEYYFDDDDDEHNDGFEGEKVEFKLDPFIIELTGITDEMLVGAPKNDDAVAAFLKFAGDSQVWAYNAGFDSGFINQFTEEKRSFRDVLSLARRAFPNMHSYKLGALAESLEISAPNAHRAVADCLTAHQVLKKTAEIVGLELSPNRHDFDHKEYQASAEGVFFGKTLVFTGALQVMTRDAAAAKASAHGFTIAGGVSKKVHYLVVGIQDMSLLAGHDKSSKHRKAEDLIEQGHSIQIITENDFVQMCGD
jgi:DNA polymerase III subunit epsilon